MGVANVLPLAMLLGASFVGAWVTAEIGFQVGAFRRKRVEAGSSTGAGVMVGSLFALLSFMLAFTFGSAASRYDYRRQLVIDEADAVSTAFLRADLLESPWAERLQEHLLEYADLRIRVVEARTATDGEMGRVGELHALMWADVVEATQNRPLPTNSLVLQSVNEVIDLHTDRIAAGFYNRIPPTIWAALLMMAASGMMSIGYVAGLAGPRPSLVAFLLMFAFSAVIMLIADLDSNQSGWLGTNQEALQDAAQVMKAGR